LLRQTATVPPLPARGSQGEIRSEGEARCEKRTSVLGYCVEFVEDWMAGRELRILGWWQLWPWPWCRRVWQQWLNFEPLVPGHHRQGHALAERCVYDTGFKTTET